ncbi:MAG: hypothetical protein M1840_008705 [Geoglossum simile]|nr:MAG: hypothetical protein M1840_008705 [Geoglossum simile]
MEYQPFKDKAKEIRLITILPAEDEAAEFRTKGHDINKAILRAAYIAAGGQASRPNNALGQFIPRSPTHLRAVRYGIAIAPWRRRGISQQESSQIKCLLDVVSLADRFHTQAYQIYRSNTSEVRGYGDYLKLPATAKPVTHQGFEEWVEVSAAEDDATVNLPEFRYIWGDYMALSYTWGDPTVTREILVNGYSMRVTKNVEDCLRVLRDKPYIKKGWRIWIDSLCINQADIIERGSQVKRMHDIYNKAWTPIIWLGGEEEDSDNAMALVKVLASSYTMRDQVNALTEALHRDPKLFGEGSWRSLHQLAIRRYWSRMWILQEAAMGRKNTPVLCGRQTLPWVDFFRAFSLLGKTDEVLNKFMTDELKDIGLEFSLVIWATLSTVGEIQLLQDAQIGRRGINLYRLLHLGRTVYATDPRDKVYGVLELMDDSLSTLITPDYAAPFADVYIDFAKATICANGSLDVIRLRYPTENKDIPSWVPDFTVEPNNSPLNASNTAYMTSGSSVAEVQYPSGKLLSCGGFRIDKFDGMGCMWSSGWSPDTVVQTTGSVNPYGSLEAVRDAIWKALVANRNIDGEPLHEDYSSLLATPSLQDTLDEPGPLAELCQSNIFQWFVNSLQGDSAFEICGRQLREYFIDARSPPNHNIDPVLLRDALMQRDHITVRRRIITTGRGYVGMASETVQKDDIICVLLGCSVPVVLRQVDKDSFEYVGECYVHGVMEGEAMQWLKTGECQLEDFVLC